MTRRIQSLRAEKSTSNFESSQASTPLFVPDQLAIIVSSILLSAAMISWLLSYYLMPTLMGSSSDMVGGTGVAAIVSSLSLPSAGFFEVVWVVGMVAMMFPAMIPKVLFYDKNNAELETNPFLAKLIGTPIFLAGYLASYALLGIGAYLAIYAAIALSSTSALPSVLSIIAPSAILIATGVYQFSSFKSRCLSHCISPLGFFANYSRRGLLGAFRMGLIDGKYCVGCCWAYMIVMLAVGVMSIPVMAALAGVIAVEKVIVRGSVWFNRGVALGFILLGITVGFFPSILMLI